MNNKRQALDLWDRAVAAFRTAKYINSDNDSVANRCYYAAFHAVSALFALEGKTFNNHGAVQSAVHRDLVKTGRWPLDLGAEYTFLLEARIKADYGGGLHVMDKEATRVLDIAGRILAVVHAVNPDIFILPEGLLK